MKEMKYYLDKNNFILKFEYLITKQLSIQL